MPLKDNESSDDETQDFTTTKVLLGYASKESTDDLFSQLGGYPKWLQSEKPPSAQLARCKVCHNMMALMLQLNGDLPAWFPEHERRLYIFTCKNKACRRKDGSIRAIRAVRFPEALSNKAKSNYDNAALQEDRNKQKAVQDLGNMLFNSNPRQQNQNANPFSISNFQASNRTLASTAENLFKPQKALLTALPSASSPVSATSNISETFAQKLRISSSPSQPLPREPWPPFSDIPSPYSSYHLDADFETLDSPSLPSSSAHPMHIDDPSSAASKDEDADAFESPSLDKVFRRFADRLAQNPLQVLRYEFAGSPLLYSKSDSVGKLLAPHQSPSPTTNRKITVSSAQSGIPRCQSCNASRVFELQLTPQSIAELEAEEVGIEGMEWGNVVLGVCSADCMPRDVESGQVGYLEEWVGVQWEETRVAGAGQKG